MTFKFNILKKHTKSKARLAIISTPHGDIQTPNFIFCGTKASIKGLTPETMKTCNTQFILSNTYHLMLQPGADLVQKMGGLHKFMGWDGPMLTDSGGYQIFSLGHGSVSEEIKGKRNTTRKSLLKITEEGAKFKSYIDGSYHTLTPETSIQIQRKLGADLILVLDECTPFHKDKSYTEKSMHMSHRWSLRSVAEFNRDDPGTQRLYGIVQGGIYPDLRKESAEFNSAQEDFFGIAVGGSLGAHKDQMYEVVDMSMTHLRQDKPVHLLGIGGVKDIWKGVRMGIDTFDCVHPTRIGRHGHALIRSSDTDHINLKNARFREDEKPIDERCGCPTCQNFSRSYLHHLLKAKELVVMQLLTQHNVYFMNEMMHKIRDGLHMDDLEAAESDWFTAMP